MTKLSLSKIVLASILGVTSFFGIKEGGNELTKPNTEVESAVKEYIPALQTQEYTLKEELTPYKMKLEEMINIIKEYELNLQSMKNK